MTPECIAPKGGNVKCEIDKFKDRWHIYMDCHRFDQSTKNAAFFNLF